LAKHRIAVVPGDGIGVEVTEEALKVLGAVEKVQPGLSLQFTRYEWGTDYYIKHGRMMPENALEVLAGYDAIYFGAVGDPRRIPDHITLGELLLPIRRGFDQYACVRPVLLLPGVECPLVGKKAGHIDMVVIRENTEGEYSNVGGRVHVGTDGEVAIQTSVFTRRGTERIIRFAFDLARKRNKKKKVTSITKSNAHRYGMVFWDDVFKSVAKDYPDIEADYNLVDAAAMNFVRRPESFDVVVASNLFGDILTDLGAIIMGGMGFAPSANLNAERKYPSMFESVHGSAPDIAGRGIANPIAAIWAGAMMLGFIGEEEAERRVMDAMKKHLAEGKVKTPDLGGKARTKDVGDNIARIIKN
jgi:tartrate dehydrogenase/decarboxylase/D-malate dehydrogenase